MASEDLKLLRRVEKVNSIYESLCVRALEFGEQMLGPDAMSYGWFDYAFGKDSELRLHFTNDNQTFFSFFIYHWNTQKKRRDEAIPAETSVPERSIASAFLKSNRHGLSKEEQQFLKELINEPFSFWQILKVEDGSGFEVLDLFRNDKAFVSAPKMSLGVHVEEIVFGQVVKAGSLSMLCGTGDLIIPSVAKEVVTGSADEIRRDFKYQGKLLPSHLHQNAEPIRWGYFKFREALLILKEQHASRVATNTHLN